MTNSLRRNPLQRRHLGNLEERYLGGSSPNVGLACNPGQRHQGMWIDGLRVPKLLVIDRACQQGVGDGRLVVVRGFVHDSNQVSSHLGTLFCHVEPLPLDQIAPTLFNSTSSYRAELPFRLRLSRLRIVALELSGEAKITVEGQYSLSLRPTRTGREMDRRTSEILGTWCNRHVRKLFRTSRVSGEDPSGLYLTENPSGDKTAPFCAKTIQFEDDVHAYVETQIAPGELCCSIPLEVSAPEMNEALRSGGYILPSR